MIVNSYRGQVSIAVCGSVRVLRYGWPQIAQLQERYGNDFAAVIMQAIAETNVRELSEVLAIGVRDNWPDVTADVIFNDSPPIMAVTAVINSGLTLAFHGPKGVPDDPASRPNLAARILAAISFWKPSSTQSQPT